MGWFSNYCGLGGYGVPEHATDRLCEQHDHNYGELMEHGINPYTTWNEADATFIRGLKQVVPESVREHVVWTVADAIFRLKRAMLSNYDDDERPARMWDELHVQVEEGHLRGSITEPTRRSKRTKRQPRQEQSLSNLPTEEHHDSPHMAPTTKRRRGEMLALPAPTSANDGETGSHIQAAEGGEQQVTPVRHVWRRFPNTETAALRWIYTCLVGSEPGSGGAASNFPATDPFDQAGQIKTGGTAIYNANLTAVSAQDPKSIADTAVMYDLHKPLLIQLRATSASTNVFCL